MMRESAGALVVISPSAIALPTQSVDITDGIVAG
ncbi:hypothetical protein RCH23_002585 [Cryobacterium sp. CAN_C3]|nr:hypothetical protein [Cryobacterium sp. CAN_C3]